MEKKKTAHTSTEAKRRYNEKTYDILSYRENKKIAEQFRKKCARLNISQAQVLKKAVRQFLEKEG